MCSSDQGGQASCPSGDIFLLLETPGKQPTNIPLGERTTAFARWDEEGNGVILYENQGVQVTTVSRAIFYIFVNLTDRGRIALVLREKGRYYEQGGI